MNQFQKTYPALLLFYFSLQLFFVFWSQHPVVIAITLTAIIVYILLLQHWLIVIKQMTYYFVYVCLITIMYAAFVHNGITPLFFYNDHAVTMEAIFRGSMLGFMFMTTVFWMKAVAVTMQTNHFLFLFTRIHPALGIFASMSFRFIPYYKDLWRDNYIGQQGIHYFKSTSRFDRLARYAKLHIHTFTSAVDAVFWKPSIMLSKGYSKKRTQFQLFSWQLKDTVLACTIIISSLLYLLLLDEMFEYYPQLANIQLSPWGIIVICIFNCIPIMIEGKELLKWRYLQSKM